MPDGDKLTMRKLIALLLSLIALAAHPAVAQVVVTETVEETVYESAGGSERFVVSAAPNLPLGIAKFGPFRVLDATRVALVDVTDARSPAQFAALLKEEAGPQFQTHDNLIAALEELGIEFQSLPPTPLAATTPPLLRNKRA